MRTSAVIALLIGAASAAAEAPLQPIKDAASLPAELQNATMIAVIHQWTPFDKPWKTVSHVTIPVGKAKMIEGDDRLLAFDPATKRVSPCQVHVVAVAGDGSPEVAEAIFQDELSVGSNVRCVFLKTGPPTQSKPDDEPWTLVTKDDEVSVRMVDALGVKYSASLFSNRVGSHKAGPFEYTEEFFSRLSAEPPEQVGIVQPFRFHTFVTARKGEPYFDVRVLIENACDSQPAAEFPFVSLEMETKRAVVREEPPLAARQPLQATSIIPPNSDVKFHVAPDHFLMRLRFALAKPEFQDRAKLRMQHEPLYVAVPGLDPAGKPTNSWNSKAEFGPTRVGIPRGDGPHTAIRDRVDREAAAYLQGSPLLKKIGPWWVHGEVGGEAPSGVEIAFTCPWAAKFIQSGGAPAPWRLMSAVFDANLARQRFGFWKEDGSLWTLDDVLETRNGVQCTPELNIHSGKPHPTPWCRKFGRNERREDPSYKALKAVMDDPAKMAGYVKELEAYTNYDDEHLCRFTQYLFPLVWLGNDPVAKLILEAQASVSMASSNPFPTSAEGESTSGSLAELHAIAAKQPGRGSPHLARGAGWNAQAVVGGLAVTKNPALQRLGKKWLSDWAKLPTICQLPTGGVHRTDQDQKATFDFDGDGQINKHEREMAVEHGSIYMQGIYRFAGCRSVRMQLDPKTHAAEIASLDAAMTKLDRYFIDFAWDDSVDLPGWNNVVVVKSWPQQVVAKKSRGTVWGGSPDAAFYFDDILAEARRLSGEERFLEKLAAMHGGKLEVPKDEGNSIHAAWVLERLKVNKPR